MLHKQCASSQVTSRHLQLHQRAPFQPHWRGIRNISTCRWNPRVDAYSGSAGTADGGGDAWRASSGSSGGAARSGGSSGGPVDSGASAAGEYSVPQPEQQPQQQPQQQDEGAIARVKRWLSGGKLDKQKLAEYGLGAFAAYGIISNLNAGVLMTMSWLAVVKRSGVSPLEGEWAQFLAIYAGLWVGASFMRPIRLSMALAAAPLINAFMDATQRRLRVNRGVAFGLLLAMIAVGSFTVIFGTIAALGGFPNGVPQVPWRR